MSSKADTQNLLADAQGIARAAQILREAGIVAIPTETVYGLAARADSAQAVSRVYAAKQRPDFNPLIVHVASLDQAGAFADLDRPVADWSGGIAVPDLRSFAQSVWPGPVTLVVPCRKNAPAAPAITAGLETIALRMPQHEVARAVIEAAGPVAAPSANRSGFTSPTTASHVLATLDGHIDAVLDAGPTSGGIESTILKLREDGRWEELRPGPLDITRWHESWFARPSRESRGATIEAPGQLAKHYSPGKPVRLSAIEAEPDEFLIGFGAPAGDCNLSEIGELSEAARNLYACLHEAARSAKPRIAIAPIPAEGIGLAINDRLSRAAAS